MQVDQTTDEDREFAGNLANLDREGSCFVVCTEPDAAREGCGPVESLGADVGPPVRHETSFSGTGWPAIALASIAARTNSNPPSTADAVEQSQTLW